MLKELKKVCEKSESVERKVLKKMLNLSTEDICVLARASVGVKHE